MKQSSASRPSKITRVADTALELVCLTQLTTEYVEQKANVRFNTFGRLLTFASGRFAGFQEQRLR